ncbi:MAG TPA: BTAD domain-containing putative transcriptional regulator [Longimicrobium sp.]|uniref:BTAD domain-containing putative transcriptional regulator n=1 Tax=Longimicrobium sp. TaxID=2029185 RepID=UPI002ED9DC42
MSPPIQLRVLGATDLRAADGEPIRRILTQPKRMALLVYVALARPRGYQRRERLLLRFWPDAAPDRGRSALRLALHHLRRELGDAVLLNRGDDEVGLAEGALACDAIDFERAALDGRHEEALELYRGPLMAGFELDGAAEWDDWLGAERARLARLASSSATALAARAEGEDDAAAELRWRRAAVELDPDDEVALRALLIALDAAGNRAGALAAYEAFCRRMRAGFDSEPAAETAKLAQAIRDRRPSPSAVRPPPPAEAAPVESVTADLAAAEFAPAESTPAAPPASAPRSAIARADADAPGGIDPTVAPSSPALQNPSPRARKVARRWRAVLAAAAVLACAAVAVPALRGGMGEDDSVVSTRVAVLPFAVRTGTSHTYLGEGMADLLSVRLDGTGELTTVDPYALLSFLRSGGDDQTSLEAGRKAAARFGAGRFILGSVMEAGGRVHLTAALYGADGRRLARAEIPELREDSLFGAVDVLVRTLVAEGMHTPPEQLDRTAALTTASLPALKSYLAGERAFRKGAFQRAAEQFGAAVEGDSTFALALYRLSVAQDWAAQDGSAAAARAMRMSHRLSAADQQLLRARVAFRTGSAAVAEPMLRALVASRPDHVEAWNELGEVLHHRAMWQGRTLETARPAWEQVIALDSSNVNARAHLLHIAALQGRMAEMDRMVGSIATLSPAHESLTRMRTLRAFALRDEKAQAIAIDTLRALSAAPRDANDLPAWAAAWRTADFLNDPEPGLRLAALMTEPGRSAQSRLVGHTTRAHMQMARGRWRAARAQADSAAQIDREYAARTWAFLAAFFPADLPHAEVARARRELAATRIPRKLGVGGVVDEERGRYPQARHHYLLGALALRMGDTAEARGRAATLAAMVDTTANGRFARHLNAQLQARMRAAAGDVAGALATMQAGWPEPVPELFVKDDSYSTIAERYFRARLLAAAGRDVEALAWFGSLPEDISRGIVFPVAAEGERARILDRLGRRREAAQHYARFAERWREAEPELLAAVTAARQRAAALEGEAR